ncbi:MAG TPA: hypothetical protein VGQ57_09260 [Polyangiaceae bacterium]|jgi:hypothetical protein|nr:hypothetical protein [Polyangiaceae bacterium]
MPKLEKAMLQKLDANFRKESDKSKRLTVQFNPETLKVSFANQVQTPSGSGDQRGTPGRQFVGAGTTKLAVQLWFDVGAQQGEPNAVDDVRRLTQKVAYFITPEAVEGKLAPPCVRFVWGSFQFDGIMESLEESLEFFSPEGRPLRATVSFALTQQKITTFVFNPVAPAPPGAGGSPGGGAAAPGTKPLTEAPEDASLQSLAAGADKQDAWQAIARANGIENPRLLAPGQLLDLNPPLEASVSLGGLS